MKLIAASCVYMESQYIGEMLPSLQLIRDLDAIHISDGAWIRGGPIPQSTDMTKMIVEEFAKTSPIPIHWTESNKFFASQGHKRNQQLAAIEKMYPGEDIWIFVIDGDEELVADGPMDLKPILARLPGPACIEAFGFQQKLPMKTLRFIPGNRGIHYHTQKTMRIHDASCSLVMDYEQGQTRGDVKELTGLHLVNKWNIRNQQRMAFKMDYLIFKDAQPMTKCQWREILVE